MVFRYFESPPSLGRLREEMDRLLSGFLGELPDGFGVRRPQLAVNLWETDDAVKVELEVPGVRSDQIDISVVGQELVLKVRRPEDEPEGVAFHRRERAVGELSRALRLPCDVDADRVEAQLRDGVLTITLPKAETAKPRKVHVSSG